LVEAGALDGNCSALQLRQLFRQRKPDAQTPLTIVVNVRSAGKGLENLPLKFRRNAAPAILAPQDNFATFSRARYLDPAPVWRVLGSIAEQVSNDLLQPRSVRHERHCLRRELKNKQLPAFVRGRLHSRDFPMQEFPEDRCAPSLTQGGHAR